MRAWTVRELYDALGDLITRRPGSASHEVVLFIGDDARLTAVEPYDELRVTRLVAGVRDPQEATKRGG